MSEPVGYLPGLLRPIIKCPTDGWYLETDAQTVLSRSWSDRTGEPGSEPATCRHCRALVPWELEHVPPVKTCDHCNAVITDANAGEWSDLATAPWCKPCHESLWGYKELPS